MDALTTLDRSLVPTRLGYAALLAAVVTVAAGCGSGTVAGVPGDAGDQADGSIAADAGVCETTLCGDPSVCCKAAEECLTGRCLAVCATGVRCGATQETCCAAGDVCLKDVCVTPAAACADSYDCVQPGEFCEPTLGRCLPQPAGACESVPSFTGLTATEEWSFTGGEIISIPVVADLTGDGVPEVVVNLTKQDGGGFDVGNIAVLNGRTGLEQLRIPHDPAAGKWGSHGRATVALGDVSGDGRPDIVYVTRRVSGSKSYLVAVDAAGHLLWIAHDAAGASYPITAVNAAVTLANFDDDPMAEVVLGAVLVDHDGRIVWDQDGSGAGGAYGSNSGYVGGISAVADLDGDAKPEIVSGRNAWKVAWTPSAPPTVSVTSFWTYSGSDGYPAVADLDADGTPEVVLVGSSQVAVLDGQTGTLWCGVDSTDAACLAAPSLRTAPLPIPGGVSQNRGGPPTLADFDADGRIEIGVAGGYAYSVYDVNRAGEVVAQPSGDPPPAAGALFVKWSRTTQDLSSNATGSSVFDFQGDGAAEVVYADECFMRVYSGTDGTPLLEVPNSSATIHEYPLVVDVDADGNSEILIVANPISGCPNASRKGLFVYGDANDEWVPTRRVWTQHAYHVTNATSEGNVPLVEANNWTAPGLNNYRQNVQGEGVFNAPDLTIDLTFGLSRCGEEKLELRARVANAGALGVWPGAEVTFFQGEDAAGTRLGAALTAVPLLPGASTVVTLAIQAPVVSQGPPIAFFATVAGNEASLLVSECDETNNSDGDRSRSCPVLN